MNRIETIVEALLEDGWGLTSSEYPVWVALPPEAAKDALNKIKGYAQFFSAYRFAPSPGPTGHYAGEAPTKPVYQARFHDEDDATSFLHKVKLLSPKISGGKANY